MCYMWYPLFMYLLLWLWCVISLSVWLQLCLHWPLIFFQWSFLSHRLYHSGFTQINCSLLVEWWESWLSNLPLPNAHDPLFWLLEFPDFTDNGPGPISGHLFSFQVKKSLIVLTSKPSSKTENTSPILHSFSLSFSPQILNGDDKPNHVRPHTLLLGGGTHLLWN